MRLRAPLLFVLCAAVSFAQNTGREKDPAAIGNRKVATGLNFYSLEREMALGRQLSLEVEKQAKVLEDPLLSEYVNRIGQNLARHSDVTFPVSIKILDADQPNAFTLPGGHVFVNSGLIRLSETEAELASAIAHELGHVAARHATRQATRQQIAGGVSIPLVIFAGPAGAAARQAMPLGFLKLSRIYETEADLLGLQYLYETGYDPTASVDIFERMEALERKRPRAVGQLFITHPVTADRIAKAEKMIGEQLPPRPEYVVNTSEYEEMRERLIDSPAKRKSDNRPTLLRSPEIAASGKDDFRP